MKRKILLLSMVLGISLGAVACSNKPKTEEKPSTTNNEVQGSTDEYNKIYSTSYKKYLTGLDEYTIYNTPESVNKSFEGKEYPGNEKYLSDVKKAYKDSRDKVQSFVDSLKSDAKTSDKDIKKMNNDLIAEGEKFVSDMDAKIKKLDEMPKETLTKGKDDFIKAVNDITNVGSKATNNFEKMLKDMNTRIGIGK